MEMSSREKIVVRDDKWNNQKEDFDKVIEDSFFVCLFFFAYKIRSTILLSIHVCQALF